MQDVLCVWFGSAGFDRSAQGLLGAGRRLADELGGKLHALVLGPGDDGAEAAKIADSVRVVSDVPLDAYSPEQSLNTIASIAKEVGAKAVLLANDAYSQELSPRLAKRLDGSSIGDGVKLVVADGRLRVTRSVYGGKAMAVVEMKRDPAVVWLRARAIEPAEPKGNACEIETVSAAPGADNAPKLVKREAEQQQGVRLEDAKIIVSGGRGLGGPEPFELLAGLAKSIGAEVAASRAACDAGWVPPSWQVGQTGKKVAPDLYIAVAISGASQHIIGIADAKVICAINTDPQAPIFKHCKFGLVEDYRKVVDPLREKLAARKG